MKRLIFAVLFPAMVLGLGARVPSSGSSPTIPTSFTVDNQYSEVLDCPNSNALKIYNETAGVLAIGWGTGTSAPTSVYDYCPAGTGTVCTISILGGIAQTVYIRSDTGSTITSGVVRVACVNEEKP